MKKSEKSNLLKKLEGKIVIVDKTKNYLKEETSKIRKEEEKLKRKISKEKKAISLINRAKKLRH
ncbi:MAG: hypothetical protein KKF68_02400 [Nanoarchaeota archaeon]|nr:hypothetical protein [Nanoarchaeota archaeon]